MDKQAAYELGYKLAMDHPEYLAPLLGPLAGLAADEGKGWGTAGGIMAGSALGAIPGTALGVAGLSQIKHNPELALKLLLGGAGSNALLGTAGGVLGGRYGRRNWGDKTMGERVFGQK